jgi:hypothetical protein
MASLLTLVALLALDGAGERPLVPGWLAEYESLADPSRRLARAEARPAFTWGHSPPHPLLGTGRFRVRWRGLVLLEGDEEELRWDAFAAGRLSLRIGGAEVLAGAGESPEAWIEGRPHGPVDAGEHEVVLEYESPEAGPARLQLWWEGGSFRREPFPAWAAAHRLDPASSAELAASRAIDEGHALALARGCLRCHALEGGAGEVAPPGPRLERLAAGSRREWLLALLDDPRALRPGARMPRLFPPGRSGFVERWLVAEHLLAHRGPAAEAARKLPWRPGKKRFVEIGCAACHLLPDVEAGAEVDAEGSSRRPLRHLAAHLELGEIARLILEPFEKHAGAEMPRFALSPREALEIASYLVEFGDAPPALESIEPPARAEIVSVIKRLGLGGELPAAGELPAELLAAAGGRLAEEKGCGACHEGLPGPGRLRPLAGAPAGGCFDAASRPVFAFAEGDAERIRRFLEAAGRGWSESPFHARRLLLGKLGCFQCHPRGGDDASPLLALAGRLDVEMFSARLPYLRVPALAGAGNRFQASYLRDALENGIAGARPSWYSYRMPGYGAAGREAARALLEGDGEWLGGEDEPERAPRPPARPEEEEEERLAAAGRELAGHGGYSCISCHPWKGLLELHAEPGSAGPDLTAITRRVRREWFDRWLESPQRFAPRTPMPAFFPRGMARAAAGALGGDPELQKEALWRYLERGAEAAPPRTRPPAPLAPPRPGSPPRAGQVPLRLAGGGAVEALAIQLPSSAARGDLLVYDVERLSLHSWWEEAALLRDDAAWRTWLVDGAPLAASFGEAMALGFGAPRPLRPESNAEALAARHRFLGFEVLEDGVHIRTRLEVEGAEVLVREELRIAGNGAERALLRRFEIEPPAGLQELFILGALPGGADPGRWGIPLEPDGAVRHTADGTALVTRVELARERREAAVTLHYPLRALRPRAAPAARPLESRSDERELPSDATAGSRPGYRAIELRDDAAGLVMPCALSVRPSDGKLFFASMKMGLIYRLDLDSGGEGRVRFIEVAGPFQEPYGMAHRGADLYLLHRRNLSRLVDAGAGGLFEVERAATWPQGLVSSYDWAYGLVLEEDGSFLFGLAPWANRRQKGSGGVLRLHPGGGLEEVAFGFRNHFGWCGAGGELFVTDNQGEWVAANRLSHVEAGRFYGFPNPEQLEHRERPRGETALWVPYAWARSINGLAFDASGGRFGPFAGQFFLAELYSGGAIIRAQLERVNGVFQGACFPFWGAGLLGPLALAFDLEGRLYAGSITEPAWMGQPDRGALYRIEFTGETPFEIQSLHARPAGFEVVFTLPLDIGAAARPAAYDLFHYRYAYGPEYGSPELDRTPVRILAARPGADGRRVELDTGPLEKGRIYRLRAAGIRSAAGEPLVQAEAAYTLNEVPGE